MEVEKKENNKLDEEENKLYDRQLRVWGKEVQQKIKTSKVMISPMSPCNIDLAKNLILSGINITIFDDEKITEQDHEENPLIQESDLNKNRGEIIAQRLREMNTLVKIEAKPSIDIMKMESKDYGDLAQSFDIIAVNTTCFKEMKIWDNVSKETNTPLYILVSCGLYGFAYISLGKSYTFIREKKKQVQMAEDNEEAEVIEDEDHKVQMEKVTINCLKFENAFTPIRKRVTNVFQAIKMMKFAQEQKILQKCDEKIQETEEFQDKCFQIIDALFKQENRVQKEKNPAFFRQFSRQYGINYCPVYSILGSVISQEMIKIIGKNDEPTLNWFCYDSQEGYGKVENFQNKESYQYSDIL